MSNPVLVSAVTVTSVAIILLVVGFITTPSIFLMWDLPWAITVFAFLVAATRAFVLREVITSRLRKGQALGIALLAASAAWFSANFIFPHPMTQGNLPGDVYFIFQALIPFLAMFYWVDISVLNARRFDPLLRDTIRWSRVRKGVWGLLGLMLAIDVLSAVVLGDVLGLAIFNSPLLAIPIFTILGAPFAAGLTLLPVTAKRTQDLALRQHLRWFVYFVGFLGLGFLFVVISIVFSIFVLTLAWPAMWVVSGYCLYKSAGSLVVVSQLPAGVGILYPDATTGES